MSSGLLEKVGLLIAGKAVNYGAEAVGGQMAYRNLVNIKDGVAEQVAPVVGEVIGDFLGRAVAGHNLGAAKAQADGMAVAIRAIGQEAIHLAHPEEKHEVKEITAEADVAVPATSKKGDKTVEKPAAKADPVVEKFEKFAQAAAVIGGVCLMAGAPAAPLGLAIAAAQYGPKILGAIKAPVDSKKKDIDFVDNVLVPVAKDIAIQSAGFAVQGVAQFGTVEGVYNSVVQQGENLGRRLAALLPASAQDKFGAIGRVFGHVEAGRQALSEPVVQQAVKNGEIAKNVVVAGLDAIDAVVVNQTKKEEKSYMDVAKNVAIIGAGILGGTALVLAAPEAAAVAGGAALLSAAPNAIKWIKQHNAHAETEQITPVQVKEKAEEVPAAESKAEDVQDAAEPTLMLTP